MLKNNKKTELLLQKYYFWSNNFVVPGSGALYSILVPLALESNKGTPLRLWELEG